MLLGELVHLLGLEAGVGEHADLAGDVAPVVLAAELLEVLLEQGAHLDDAVGHLLDLAEPLLVQGGRVEDLGRDAGAVDGRVGVEGADEDLDLRVDALLLGRVGADHAEGADALAVQTHVLGKRLGQADVVALGDEVAHGEGVLVDVARGETLVGHVEEGEVTLGLDGLLDLHPLLGSRVDTGRVVGAGVEEEDGALGGGVDVAEHAVEVEADGVGVIVGVLLDGQAGVLEDGGVVGPAGLGNVDGLGAGEEAGQEGAADAEGTSAGDGLGDGQTAEGVAVLAIGENGSGLGELGDTGDASILLVEARGNHLLLSSPDGGENVGLALVIAVGTNTCCSWLTMALGNGGGARIGWRRDCEPRLIFFSKESALKASVIPVDELLAFVDRASSFNGKLPLCTGSSGTYQEWPMFDKGSSTWLAIAKSAKSRGGSVIQARQRQRQCQ